jgi:general bacterial porin, GBP family
MNSTIYCSIAGASLAALSTICAAQAVSLYGELDTGLAYVSNVNGHTQYRATSGLIDGSYWGLQGSEELGGGAKAVFRLERGFSVTSGEEFNDHPAYVGLQSEPLGTLTLGHQYDLIHDYFAPFTLTGGTGGTAFAHPFDNDNANNSYLARNSVKYASPSFGGFSLGAMYAFSNDAGAFANNRAYSIGASYQGGALSAGAAWLHANGRGNTQSGAYDPVVLPGSTGEVFDANVQTQNTYGFGASYTIGDLVVAAAWSRSTYSNVINAETGDAAPSVGFSNYEVNGVYQLTPAVALAAMYTYTKASTAHWHEGAVQMTYALSKRTDTYVEAVYQRASSGAPAVINTNDPSSSRNQLLIATGIRHHF